MRLAMIEARIGTMERFGRNIAWLAGAEVVGKLLAFLYLAYLARSLGATAFGTYTVVFIFASLAMTVTDFGFGTLITRDVAKEKKLAGEYVANSLLLQLPLFLSVWAFLALSVNLLDYSSQLRHLVILAVTGALFSSLGNTLNALFNAHEEFRYPAVISILVTAIRAALYVGVVRLGYGIDAVILASVVAAFVYFLLSVIFNRQRMGAYRWRLEPARWRYLLREGLSFALLGILVVIYFRADTIILSRLKGEMVTGWYGAAFRIFEVLLVLPSLVSTAIFPIMSRFHVSARDLNKVLYSKYLQYMLLFGLPMAVGATLLADDIVILLFGEAFLPSAGALALLIWTLMLIFVNSPPAAMLNSDNRQWMVMVVTVVASLLNITLAFLLIPSYSLEGAALAALIPRVMVFFSLQVLVSRYYFRPQIGKYIPRLLLANAAMGALIYLGRGLHVLLLIPLGAAVYFSLLYFLSFFDDLDRTFVRRVLFNKA